MSTTSRRAAPTSARRPATTRSAGEGLCVGYDTADAVSKEYPPKFRFAGGRIVKVVFDVADDVYVDMDRKFAAVMAGTETRLRMRLVVCLSALVAHGAAAQSEDDLAKQVWNATRA
jgi:hypothetical protein